MQEPNYDYPYDYYAPSTADKFARASMILGFAALFSIVTFFLPIPLSALGLLFFVLSRRKNRPLNGMAKAGAITSGIAFVIGIIIMAFSIFYAVMLFKPENRDLLDKQFTDLYGVTFEEYVTQTYGEDFDINSLFQ